MATALDYYRQFATSQQEMDEINRLLGYLNAAAIGPDMIASAPEEFSHLAGYNVTPEATDSILARLTELYAQAGLDPTAVATPEDMANAAARASYQGKESARSGFFEQLRGLEQSDPAAYNQELAALPFDAKIKYEYLKYKDGLQTADQYSQRALDLLAADGRSEFALDQRGSRYQLNLFGESGLDSIGTYSVYAGPETSALERMTSNPFVNLALAMIPGAGPWLSAGMGAANIHATGDLNLGNALQVVGGISQGVSNLGSSAGTVGLEEAADQAAGRVLEAGGSAAEAQAAYDAAVRAGSSGSLGSVLDVVKDVGRPAFVLTNQGMTRDGEVVGTPPLVPVDERAGGGGGGGAPPMGPGSEWVYPREEMLDESDTPISRHTNPDGSVVVIYSGGKTQWEKPPTDFSQWPQKEDTTNQPGIPYPPAGVAFPLPRTPTGAGSGGSQSQGGLGTGAGNGAGSGSGTGSGSGSGAGDGPGTGDGGMPDDALQDLFGLLSLGSSPRAVVPEEYEIGDIPTGFAFSSLTDRSGYTGPRIKRNPYAIYNTGGIVAQPHDFDTVMDYLQRS